MGHCQSRWKNVPVSCVHIEQAVVVSGLKRATLGSPLFYLGIMHCKWLPITLLLRSRATAGRDEILLTSVGKSHGRSAPPVVALDQSGSESHDRSEYNWNKLFRVFIFFFTKSQRRCITICSCNMLSELSPAGLCGRYPQLPYFITWKCPDSKALFLAVIQCYCRYSLWRWLASGKMMWACLRKNSGKRSSRLSKCPPST